MSCGAPAELGGTDKLQREAQTGTAPRGTPVSEIAPPSYGTWLRWLQCVKPLLSRLPLRFLVVTAAVRVGLHERGGEDRAQRPLLAPTKVALEPALLGYACTTVGSSAYSECPGRLGTWRWRGTGPLSSTEPDGVCRRVHKCVFLA